MLFPNDDLELILYGSYARNEAQEGSDIDVMVLVDASCKQHIEGSCFCIHSASLCLLVGAFYPFTFKVIIDKYDPVTIYFIVLGSGLYTLFVFPV